MTDEDTLTSGELSAAISTAVVHMLAETTGRGPTKAKTTLRLPMREREPQPSNRA